MNIMFVASDNYQFSGAFLSMVKLASVLKEQYGHKVIIVLPPERFGRKRYSGRELLKKQDIKYVVLPSCTWTVRFKNNGMLNIRDTAKAVFGTIGSCIAVPQICKLIKKENIDIIHVNTSWSYVGALAAERSNIPFVWHIREFLEEDQSRRILWQKKGYSLMNQANRVIAISNTIYNKYAKVLDNEKLCVIFNGIDPAGYLDSEHSILQDNCVRLLIVGSLYRHKGQWVAVEACSILRKKGILNFKLQIVGRGAEDYTQELHHMVQDGGLEPYVKFCGATDNVAQYYRKADIVLVCSKAEAFGRITVEAMLSGALVIGADSAGTSELIRGGVTGLFYEQDNSVMLAEKIEYAMAHREEMRVIAGNGRQYMLDNMTAQKNAEHINNLYEEVLKEVKEHE